jgi:hypothetical protein
MPDGGAFVSILDSQVCGSAVGDTGYAGLKLMEAHVNDAPIQTDTHRDTLLAIGRQCRHIALCTPRSLSSYAE